MPLIDLNLISYPEAVDAFLLAVHHEQAVYGGRLRDYLIERYPGNGSASTSGHGILARLHEARVLSPVHRTPGVLAHAPENDKALYRSAMAFQTLQYRDPVSALAMKGDAVPYGAHEFYTWARGSAFPKVPRRADPVVEMRDGRRWVWCFGSGRRVREIEDCRGEAYCPICYQERIDVAEGGRLARHRCPDPDDRAGRFA